MVTCLITQRVGWGLVILLSHASLPSQALVHAVLYELAFLSHLAGMHRLIPWIYFALMVAMVAS